MRLLWVLAAKDLRIEYRSRQAFQTTLFFALLVLVVFQFAFEPGASASREASAGILWVALLFPGMIRLNQSFQMETEEGGIHGIVLSPLDRGVLFLGKFLANWIFLMIVGGLTVAAFLVFYNFDPQARLFWLFPLMAMGLGGFAAVGTILAAMVANSRSREVLMPILTFPVVIPVLIAAVNGTEEVLVRDQFQTFGSWIRILGVFDVVYLAAGYLVFEYVVGE